MPPILNNKNYQAPSIFRPENLLREARRQKGAPPGNVPAICVLDPDGDILQQLLDTGQASCNPHWACYHTRLYNFGLNGTECGIIGGAVGASFAVLVAEELFVSGCELLISITSAGQILPVRRPPYFILIEKALRDEGTSYHYLPPAQYAQIDPELLSRLGRIFDNPSFSPAMIRGAVWTTDAPFRETEDALAYCHSEEILAVEMEASALYAFAQACAKNVVCFAHVTNQMGNIDGDFEKGAAGGSLDALRVIEQTIRSWLC